MVPEPPRVPYVIGLTGGIASGKSMVAGLLSDMGAEVIDADQVSRDLVQPGSALLEAMAAAWGADVLRPDGSLDRAVLAGRVFGRPAEVARLNALTHPPIMAEMCRRVEASDADVAVMMAPLLLEAGGADDVDEIWVVAADPALRIQRIVERDAATEEDARRRIAAQLDEDERLRRADVVIRNEGSLESLRAQAEARMREVRRRIERGHGTSRGE